MSTFLIRMHEATVVFGDGIVPALDRVSLSVEPGAWIAIAGDNGCGKTTMLSALCGALPLRSGRVERAPGVRVALLLQEPDNQFVAASVRHELALSVPSDVDADGRGARIAAAIERFELGTLLDRNPHRLSGGEKQRLALATVWLEDPNVLLLDEPLAYLDAPTRARVLAFVRDLNARGVAVLWATPGGDDVALAREVVVLERGRAVPANPGAAAMAGDEDLGGRAPSRRPYGVVLRMEGVSFAYDGTPVLRDVDLELRGGECAGLTGDNSSGKSTMLLVAAGALRPSAGRVFQDVGGDAVLYLPQSPERLFFAETVEEEVAFGLERRGAGKRAARERAREAMDSVGLDPGVFAARSPFHLSAGEMRRVAFAIAASLAPRLLLLDEPASCLDTAGCGALDALIRARTGAGGAVLIASHEPGHLARVASRSWRLVGGRLGPA